MKEHPDWDIWISGHSLGGALATLAASYLVKSRRVAESNTVKLVTFGQPRVGDKEFANSFDEEVFGIYQFVRYARISMYSLDSCAL
ncbi:triacylglycerol lipase [Ancylostoma caninum]|uniref:Triacylglycerol lipase n=1 Tax=Ancylostoma caninum TaxID=29170 RepID=A0A368H4Q9_ANCCA|nr:triacylglycerol lipase [Ancylostoma caninum]